MQPKKGKKNGDGGNPHKGAHPGMDEGDESPKDEGDELEGALKDKAGLVQKLEDNAQDVEEQCEGLDEAFLSDASAQPDDEQKQELEECLEALPADLVESMKSDLASISHDDAMAIANHLEDEGFVTDGEMVGGFLFHVGQVASQMNGASDGDDGGDGDEDADHNQDDDDFEDE